MISRYRMALMQVVDLCCILLALAVSGMVTIAPDLSVFDDYTGASLFTIFFYLLFFYILDAYSVGMEDFKDTLGRILVACVLGIISSATASFALENWRFDRVTVLLLFALSFVFCLGWRFLYYLNADKLTHPLRVLLVGVDRGGKVRKLLAEGLPKARILGYVGEKDQDPDAGECFGPPFMALEAAKKHGATMIVLLPDAPIDDDIAHDLLEAKLHGAMVVDIRTFYEHVVQRLPLSQITEEWLLQTEGFSLNTRGSLRRLKRAFDLFLSLMLLIPAAPIMLITALLIRLESPGPVIYRQDRVGLYEKEFTVYKFRSMRTDAEKNGAVWAAANDARVTRVGKFIRKVRIDELPQIWNIIKGDMSFIGPRPERMTFVKQLKEHIPYYSLRHTVKPGLTGWAQVCYPYGANEEDARHKLEYDLFYVKNISILLDIHIIFKTVGVDGLLQNWDKVSYEGRKEFCKRAKIALGAEFIPNPRGRNYLAFVKYRVGAYYSKPYYKIFGERAANEYGVTAGFGLPIPRTRSMVSVSAQYVHTKGTTAAFLDENTLRLCIGITFNERWFFKRRVD